MCDSQGYIFLIFIFIGILIGLLFDFFRILRKSFRTSNIMTYIEDILFCIITSIFIIYTLYIFCDGQIRIFMIIGATLGFSIYILTISKYMINISIKIINFIKKIIKILLKPIIIIYKIIYKLIQKYYYKFLANKKIK